MVESLEAAAAAIGEGPRRVFLTTGRMELAPFRSAPQHLYIVRSVEAPSPAELPPRVPGRAGWELRLVVHGGWRILEKIAHMDCATIAQRPRLHASDVPLLAWRSWRYRAAWFAPERLS